MNSKYKVVRDLSGKHSISELCQTLGISRSAYYAWRNHKPGKQALKDLAIGKEILASHTAAPCYGIDNIHADVRDKIVCGRNRVRRLMCEMNIASQRKRKYKAITNSKHSYPVSPDLVKRKIPESPNKVWVSDISYIPTDEGWLYLAIVQDLCSKEIVGWAQGSRITSDLSQEALRRAIKRYKPPAGLIHHSDRGVQYCCHEYQVLLKKHSLQSSMSRKGNPYDNAVAENFFSCLKCEMVYLNRFKTRDQAALEIFRYAILKDSTTAEDDTARWAGYLLSSTVKTGKRPMVSSAAKPARLRSR